MGSLSISYLKESFPGKTDKEIAAALAEKEGYITVLRYKSLGANDFTDFAVCTLGEEVTGYFNSPNCQAVEILYDIRSQALTITPELLLRSKCKSCGRQADNNSLVIGKGNDFLFCPVCGAMYCQSCSTQLPLTNYPYGYAKCPECDVQLQRAFPGAIGSKAWRDKEKQTVPPPPLPAADLSVEALYQQGESFIQSGKLGEAIASFRRMLEKAKSEKTLPPAINKLYNLSIAIHNGASQKNSQAGGNLYYSAGLAELDAEIAILEMLLEYDPKAADIWQGLGTAYDNACQCEKAESYYRKAVELDPAGIIGADARMNLGILAMNTAKTVQATTTDGRKVTVPMAGLKREQLFPTADSTLAIHSNSASPHWKTAEEVLNKALSIYFKAMSGNPQFKRDVINAHWNLIQLYTDQLQGSKAVPHAQIIHQMDPTNQKAIDWLKEAERNTKQKLL